jgi:hypothetical protein
MSKAPQTLIDLRVMLADLFGVPKDRFGIRGVVTPRRPWGYHLGKSDIYGPGGKGDADYSIRYRRDQRGLSDYSAGFDANVAPKDERDLVAYLVQNHGWRDPSTGKTLLVEVIGPDKAGLAKRWARDTGWKPTKARGDHSWHIHLSFYRDTESIDKRPLFFGFFGIESYPEMEEPDPIDPENPTDPPVEPPPDPLQDLREENEDLKARLDRISVESDYPKEE